LLLLEQSRIFFESKLDQNKTLNSNIPYEIEDIEKIYLKFPTDPPTHLSYMFTWCKSFILIFLDSLSLWILGTSVFLKKKKII
jgi:hypothetical protein